MQTCTQVTSIKLIQAKRIFSITITNLNDLIDSHHHQSNSSFIFNILR